METRFVGGETLIPARRGIFPPDSGGERYRVGIGGFLRGRLRSAFTLIELLIVMVIITILVALLFPTFGSLIQTAHESNTMSNMQQIQSSLALYYLDNRRYPPVLFSYACDANATSPTGAAPGCSTGDTMQTIGADVNAKALYGLYPTYIRDWHAFLCVDNSIGDVTSPQAAPVPLTTNSFAPSSRILTSPAMPIAFFPMDSMDVSPQVAGINKVVSSTNIPPYVVRYQTSWTSYPTLLGTCYPGPPTTTGACDTSPDLNLDPDYTRQLRWTNPDPSSYVTSVTYHVGPANRALVLFLQGNVKKVDIEPNTWTYAPTGNAVYTDTEVHNNYVDSEPDIGTVANSSGLMDSKAYFWRYLGK